ncbi:histone-lysine N-methyltransferase SETMAR [Trichonephila clavipes]|nr:histone-lysine N-methyltransferase SETMAR [Trichonephila clavipes]
MPTMIRYPDHWDTTASTVVRGKNDVQARKKMTDVYGEDAPCSGRPVEADKDAIKAFVDVNRRITTREIGLRLNLSYSTVYAHLKSLGLSSKLDVWVLHALTERNLCHRIDVCDSLLKGYENDPFLKRIITGDEKGHGAKKMHRLKSFPKPIFTKKSFILPLSWKSWPLLAKDYNNRLPQSSLDFNFLSLWKFCNTRKDGNRFVPCLDYMVDALKHSNQAPRVSG